MLRTSISVATLVAVSATFTLTPTHGQSFAPGEIPAIVPRAPVQGSSSTSEVRHDAPPNVILIMTDDQGYGDLGVTGNPVIRTPNIDALARRSASMSTFYVSPVCSPTRASLMTGRYNYRTRVVDTYMGRAMMEPEEVTVAEVLREAGYATGIFGKWHLGDCYPMRSIDQGFEMSLVLRGGGIGQSSDPPGAEGRYTNATLFRNGRRVETKGYCTDVYFDAAIQWIEDAHRNGRRSFTYIATNAPHGPFHDVPQELYESYRAMNLDNDQFPQHKGHALPDTADTDRRARIFAMITNIDQNVGRLVARLGALDILDDTLIIFMVDNGPNGRRYVSGFRGIKGSVYEGGIRSPFFAHWPARLAAGQTSDRIAAHIDVMPTILEACGVEPPNGVRLDGRSLLPLLEGQDVAWPDRTIVIQSHRGDVPVRYHHFATRSQHWKLVHASGFGRERFEGRPSFELYDMHADPLEMTDVAAANPQIVTRLKAAYDQWFDDVSSTRPDNYDPPRIHLGSPHVDLTVLTHQDWRREIGQPQGDGSAGFWPVHVEHAGAFNVTCRFSQTVNQAQVTLVVGQSRWTTSLDPGASSCRFEKLKFEAGNAQIRAMIIEGEMSRAVNQIDVSAACRKAVTSDSERPEPDH